MSKTEAYWLFGSISAILILLYFIIGIEFWRLSETTDINIGDTYFVISNTYLVSIIGVPILFAIYAIRAVVQKFKKRFNNLILIIANCALIYILTRTLSHVGLILKTQSSAEYPPPSGGTSLIEGNSWNDVYWGLLITQILLLITLVITAFLTGRINTTRIKVHY
ncbi:hypothetical protein SAMN04490243_2875 [Robiginitalea myxolifaciens]|uniref:Uncharacterized protein n=1 Tax=Robiginitalea myxolifaciens TaxID=400055 RepID=A0A1I6HLN5_9FLAO|nr:hypothetical protein [Robiginitalea myxolifaciens]SFR55314.1 hypothetical protein SAMN04490243_2875 [Robiginitalea myxolifaciens]